MLSLWKQDAHNPLFPVEIEENSAKLISFFFLTFYLKNMTSLALRVALYC